MRLLPLLAALPLTAANVYFFSDNFASGISSTNWYTNGTISGGSSGLASTASNGGSVIYKPAIPNASSEYEVKANITFGGTVSGPTHGLQFRPETWFTVMSLRAAGEVVS